MNLPYLGFFLYMHIFNLKIDVIYVELTKNGMKESITVILRMTIMIFVSDVDPE